ncbi:hypothetical protein LOCC1_G005526 [Lachnellula occidentalis]|uniref:Fungal N-terminal domain-containing protein n=1 Tax=Lachnellula occidentalis TaxID=215460 RepID=A0A8H8RVP3_9HELO|nr:hypothetical protein LOCC1_G005526 [Lachnellula occidentalis]
MAELGVAASAISIVSIAIQVGDSIIKLKDFWNHVKEAPEEIKWLMEEIETLGLVLSGVESSKAHDDPPHLEPAFASRCLELCRTGAGILEAVVKEAGEEIRKRRRVGGMKAVLKKGTIERLKERLRSAQLMLMLSNQAYSQALQKQRHELQREWAELQHRQLDELRTCIACITVTIQLYTFPGSIGHPIIEAAVSNGELEVAKFVISRGFDGTKDPTLFFEAISGGPYLIPRNPIELLRFVAPIPDFDYLDHHMKLELLNVSFWGNVELFTWILRQSGCSFRNLSISERVSYSARLLLRGVGHADTARFVRIVFENMKLDSTVCKTTDYLGRSLVQCITWNFTAITKEGQRVSDQCGNEFCAVDHFPHCSSEMLSLLQEVIRADSNLHGLAFYLVGPDFSFREASLQMPLLLAFSGSLRSAHSISELGREDRFIEIARSCMMAWIEQLQIVGIDLVEYGRKEKELHIQEKVSKECFAYCMREKLSKLRLTSFTYGPEPADWQFWFTEVMENYFTQFWDMVDHPERAMPGAWVEDDERLYDGYATYDPEYDSPPTVEDCDRWKPDHGPWPKYR